MVALSQSGALKRAAKEEEESVKQEVSLYLPPDHLLLDSAPNLGPLISHWEINKFGNC